MWPGRDGSEPGRTVERSRPAGSLTACRSLLGLAFERRAGDVRTVSRFPGRGHFAAYDGTAPIEVPSGRRKVYRLSRRGNRRLNHAIHMAAVTQIRHPGSEGRAYFDKKLAGARPAKKHSAPSSGESATPSTPASRPTPAGLPAPRAREGNRGTTLMPARPAHTPDTGSSGKPLPGLATTLRPRPAPTAAPGIPRSRPHSAAGKASRPRQPTKPQRPKATSSSAKRPPERLDTKRLSIGAATGPAEGHRWCTQDWSFGVLRVSRHSPVERSPCWHDSAVPALTPP